MNKVLDLGAVQPASFDLKKTERDCDLIKEMLQSHPEAIEQLMGALADEKGGKIAQVLEVSEVLEKIGFTEKAAVEKGGGFLLNQKFSLQQNICFHRAAFAPESCKWSFSQRERKFIVRK